MARHIQYHITIYLNTILCISAKCIMNGLIGYMIRNRYIIKRYLINIGTFRMFHSIIPYAMYHGIIYRYLIALYLCLRLCIGRAIMKLKVVHSSIRTIFIHTWKIKKRVIFPQLKDLLCRIGYLIRIALHVFIPHQSVVNPMPFVVKPHDTVNVRGIDAISHQCNIIRQKSDGNRRLFSIISICIKFGIFGLAGGKEDAGGDGEKQGKAFHRAIGLRG